MHDRPLTKTRRTIHASGAGRLPAALPRTIPPETPVNSTPQGGFVLKPNTDLVLTNVVARDAKTGEIVKDLKQADFKIYENGKEQPSTPSI